MKASMQNCYCIRNEDIDLKPPIDKFNENFELVKENKKAIYPNSDMIDVMRDLIQNPADARSLHLMDMNAAGEQENIDDEAILESLDTTELPEPEERDPENHFGKIFVNRVHVCYVKLSQKRPDFEKNKPAWSCRDSNTTFIPVHVIKHCTYYKIQAGLLEH